MQGDREHPYERCDWGWPPGSAGEPCQERAERFMFGSHGVVVYIVALCPRHWRNRKAHVRRIVTLALDERASAYEESAAVAADLLAPEGSDRG